MKFVKYIIIATIFIQMSCTVYTPQVVSPVLIEKRGDIEINAGPNISSYLITPGMSISSAYGVTDKICVQVFGSYISSGTHHFQAITGYNFNLSNMMNIKVFGGYFYGQGDVQYQRVLFSSYKGSPRYTGNYQSTFGKVQFTKKIVYPKSICGISLIAGSFRPNYNVKYNSWYFFKSNLAPDELINQKGIIIEPSIFYHLFISDRFGFHILYSNAWIKPINQINKNHPNRYKLDYNYFGNIGFSINYKISK